MCPTSDGIEETKQFSLLCPPLMFNVKIFSLKFLYFVRPFLQSPKLSNGVLGQFLLYGDQDLSYDLNRNIFELTMRKIHETGRLDQGLLGPQYLAATKPLFNFFSLVDSFAYPMSDITKYLIYF